MKKNQLHSIQQELLDLLIRNFDSQLTIRGMQELLNVSSTSVIAHHLVQLEKKGYLKRNPHNPRDYIVVAEAPEKEIAWLNLYGLAQCGQHGILLDNNPIDRIPLATRLLTFPSFEAFLVKAKGDSMEPKINEGDLVIGRRATEVDNGSTVICVNNGEALIKKIQTEQGGKILFSLNPIYPPFLAASDFRIIGEVRGLISRK